MRTLYRSVLVASVMVVSTISMPGSMAQNSRKEPAGSITGRVTLGGNPAARVTVILTPADGGVQQSVAARVTTDEDGRFKLSAVPAGSYTVLPHTPALVVAAETSWAQPGKTVTLGDGEEVDGIDFSLVKGGVITGRITDAQGRPLVEQRINIVRVDERGQRIATAFNQFMQFMLTTDDRGVYRVYGQSPGRYKVSAGVAPESGMVRIGFGGGTYPRTFYPDVSDEAKATAVEVTAGGEASGIDIKLGRASKTYVATGRIIDADTGKPIANLQYGHASVGKEQRVMGAFGWTGNRTNSNGEFRIEGLGSGRYAAFAVSTEQADFYSEPAIFEISDSDVSAIEIKTRSGSVISGVAVIEGTDDSDVLGRLSKLELRAFVRTEDLAAPTVAPIRINPDGSFRVTGLRPGKVRISLGSFGYEPAKGFSLVRVERAGIAQSDGIDVVAGENVSAVRLVIGYGTCVLRGQVRVQNGELAPDTRLRIMARRLESDAQPSATVADARGRFHLEGLLPGEYEITVTPMSVTPSSPGAPPPPGRLPNRPPVKQNVTVAGSGETEVTLILDLSVKDKDSDK
jgi:hypothetical protein